MATVDDPASLFGRRQSLMFDNLMRLPDEGFRYDAPVPGPALSAAQARASGPRAWVGQTRGHYALTGFDRAPRTLRGGVHLRPAARGAGGSPPTPTDSPPGRCGTSPGCRVVRGRTSLVLGNDSPARMASYRDQADAGVPRVTAVWGPGWSSHVVLLTPATAAQFAALLGRRGDTGARPGRGGDGGLRRLRHPCRRGPGRDQPLDLRRPPAGRAPGGHHA